MQRGSFTMEINIEGSKREVYKHYKHYIHEENSHKRCKVIIKTAYPHTHNQL